MFDIIRDYLHKIKTSKKFQSIEFCLSGPPASLNGISPNTNVSSTFNYASMAEYPRNVRCDRPIITSFLAILQDVFMAWWKKKEKKGREEAWDKKGKKKIGRNRGRRKEKTCVG